MRRYYPDQRPRFLFGKTERHLGITVEAARTLTYERDWFKSLVTERDNEISALRTEIHALLKSLDSNARGKPSAQSLSTRAERVYLHIIGGQLELLLSEEHPGKARRKFRTQEEVIAALTDLYGRRLGITKSTLESKFALANRMLSDRS